MLSSRKLTFCQDLLCCAVPLYALLQLCWNDCFHHSCWYAFYQAYSLS
nr:MAG TPA: hypothetical protein [Caudoviricetes sp.]